MLVQRISVSNKVDIFFKKNYIVVFVLLAFLGEGNMSPCPGTTQSARSNTLCLLSICLKKRLSLRTHQTLFTFAHLQNQQTSTGLGHAGPPPSQSCPQPRQQCPAPRCRWPPPSSHCPRCGLGSQSLSQHRPGPVLGPQVPAPWVFWNVIVKPAHLYTSLWWIACPMMCIWI